MNEVLLREFCEEDIENKVKWINDECNNRFLHYDLPLEVEKTRAWFEKNKGNASRYDAVILFNGKAVGIIGLLEISNGSAEYYITIGEQSAKGKGVATRASELLFDYAFRVLNLDKVFLYTEVDNVPAQRLFEKIGFIKMGLEKASTVNRGKSVDRYYYEATEQTVEEQRNSNEK